MQTIYSGYFDKYETSMKESGLQVRSYYSMQV